MTPDASAGCEVSKYAILCRRLHKAERRVSESGSGGAGEEEESRQRHVERNEVVKMFRARVRARLTAVAGVDPASAAETADDFLSFRSAVFDAWRQRYTDLSDEAARSEFARIMSEALDIGYRETKAALDGLHAFYTDLKSISDFMENVQGISAS